MAYSEGATPFHYQSAASTNATSVQARATRLEFVSCISESATVCHLKLYDKASAPNVGVDTPVMSIKIPASTTAAGVVKSFPTGVQFRVGLAFAITAGALDSDTSNAPLGVIINFVAR